MKFEVWPGPMEGVSRPEFVRAVNHLHLVSMWMTPFLRVSDSCYKSKKIKEFLAPYLESGLPVTAQIMGNKPEILAELAVKCMESGACGININCGCPSRRVISGLAGGGMLKDRENMLKAVREIRKALGENTLFSVKMRSGFSSSEEMSVLIPELAAAGADKFFIHYRTVQEQYSAVPGRLERFITAVTAASPLPVIINGDISSVSEGCDLIARTGAAGVMIARSFMHDPWLLARFADPASPDPETGRKVFFETLENFNISGGNRIELAKMIWGADSGIFRDMLSSHR